jgi:DNA-binding transcriptional ArsR family regulator
MRVELDRKALFALASDTRVEILRALQPMRRTVSQLAQAIGIDKAAVHRHLRKLMEGGLVKRYDDHGFVYYGLSWKARDLLDPNDNTKIVILLASSIALIAGAVFALVMGLTALLGAPSPFQPGAWPPGDAQTLMEGSQGPTASDLLWFLPGSLLLAMAILLLVVTWRLLRRPKQIPATSR